MKNEIEAMITDRWKLSVFSVADVIRWEREKTDLAR